MATSNCRQPRVKDIKGLVFGKLTVQSFSHTKNSNAYWSCLCECGSITIKNGCWLRQGDTKSCGCLAYASKCRNRKEQTREYRSWACMMQRCHDQKRHDAHNYSKRGITVCEQWHTFKNFLSDMGKAPSRNHSLDRIDNNGNYEPSNCRWATIKEQRRNKRNNRVLLIDGETRCLIEWSELSGISYGTIQKRLQHGWEPKLAVFTPIIPKRKPELPETSPNHLS